MRFPFAVFCTSAALATLWAGCPDPNGGGSGRNPRVEITLPSLNVIGGAMDVDVQVNGCAQVTTAVLKHDDRVLRTFAYTSNPTRVTLVTSDIPFAQTGVAASLLLVAQATCDDGRVGVSAVAGATFLPVAETSALPQNELIVPEAFYTEGSGANTTFVGCNYVNATDRRLVKVDRQGNLLREIDRFDVMCDTTSVFTPAVGGIRWMLTPGVGALAFDTNLVVTSVARAPWVGATEDLIEGASIIISPYDANAIIWWPPDNDQVNQNRNSVYRVRPNCLPTSCPAAFGALDGAPIVWGCLPGGPAGSAGGCINGEPFTLLGDPIVTSNNLVVLPGAFNDVTQRKVFHQIRYLDYNSPHELSGLMVNLTGATVNYGTGERGPLNRMHLNPTSALVYLPWATERDANMIPTKTEVRAYNAAVSGSALWRSPIFDEWIVQAFPFAGATRLAAEGGNQVWFLDAADGTLLNPGRPAKARNGYGIFFMEPGLGQELYIMTGSRTSPSLLPKEIIGFTSPDQPEVLRYNAGTGNLFGRVDDGGQLWLRVNNNLHRPYTLAEYLSLKQ